MDEIQIVQVLPALLHEHWSFVIRGLLNISSRHGGLDWIPEDVYAAIRVQNADLFLLKIRERKVGFWVGYPTFRQYSSLKVYLIWILWSIPPIEREPGDDTPENKEKVFQAIKNRAKEFDCRELNIWSTRKGFEKMLGFTPGVTEFRLKL